MAVNTEVAMATTSFLTLCQRDFCYGTDLMSLTLSLVNMFGHLVAFLEKLISHFLIYKYH